MTFAQDITLFVVALATFLIIDLTWLGVIAKDLYAKALEKFLVKKFDLRRAFLFYFVYIAGLLILVLVPAVNEESLGIAMGRGLAYGFFTYATYGLTNWSTIDKWPTKITFQDMAWGTFLGWAVSTISYSVYSALYF